MNKEDNGGPAFPRPFSNDTFNDETELAQSGMTLKDYFAAKVLPACYADALREFLISEFPEDWKMGVALEAYAMADAMIEARKK